MVLAASLSSSATARMSPPRMPTSARTVSAAVTTVPPRITTSNSLMGSSFPARACSLPRKPSNCLCISNRGYNPSLSEGNSEMRENAHDKYGEIREALRALCAEFPPDYHRKVDQARGYPDEFVQALTKAGWMAALIPEQYGGSGLGLTE